MSNFNGFTGDNDPVYYSRKTENTDGALTGEDTKQAGNSPVIPEGWQVEAEKLAEIYGVSFVLFRHGEAPQCADPTKVVISFTDKGLGHDTLPADPQEDINALIPLVSRNEQGGDRWIPVSERMPEDRTQVILWDAEIGEVTSGHYSHKTHTFYHCGDAIENEITHWMEPPAAPQEVPDGKI